MQSHKYANRSRFTLNRSLISRKNIMKKLLLSLLTITFIAGCAQGVDAAKRLEKCVVDGNENNNCEISTLEGQKQ